MKSYFAKLAARATFANVPVSSPLTAPKPFADTLESATAPTSLEAKKGIRPANESRTLRSFPSAAPRQTEIDNAQLRQFEPGPTESVKQGPPLTPEPQRPGLPVERTSEMKLEPPSAAVAGKPFLEQNVELTPPPTTTKLTPTVEVSPPPSGDRSADKEIDLDLPETSLTNEQHVEIQPEQSVLLRKADDFMERLFERPGESAPGEMEADEKAEDLRGRQTEEREPSRLQRMPPAARAPEPIDERPGLVIGKLIVEVIPPTPAPVAPPEQVVVVRGTRSGLTALPSSRRFGLGQF